MEASVRREQAHENGVVLARFALGTTSDDRGMISECSVKNALWLIAGLILTAVAVLGYIGFTTARGDIQIQRDSVKQVLLACYDIAASERGEMLSPERVRERTRAEFGGSSERPQVLPSFIAKSDVYFARNPVRKGSADVICAIRFGNEYYGLTGKRAVILLDKTTFQRWSHAPL